MTYAVVRSANAFGPAGAQSSANGTTYSQPVYLPDGMASAPALAASNYATSGLYFSPTGLGLATSGTGRFFIGNDGAVSVLGALAVSAAITLVNGAQVINGSLADPNTGQAAMPGSLYLSSTGGLGRSVWFKDSGMGAAGWRPADRTLVTATGAVTLTPGACVSLTASPGGGYTAALVDVAHLDATPANAVVVSADGQGNLLAATGGLAESAGSGYTPQAALYVGQNGYLSSAAPTSAPCYSQAMGTAVSATGALLNIQLASFYTAQ